MFLFAKKITQNIYRTAIWKKQQAKVIMKFEELNEVLTLLTFAVAPSRARTRMNQAVWQIGSL